MLYYRCADSFIEIEEEVGLNHYDHTRENSPPIVPMGLFMGGESIALAIGFARSHTNEQIKF